MAGDAASVRSCLVVLVLLVVSQGQAHCALRRDRLPVSFPAFSTLSRLPSPLRLLLRVNTQLPLNHVSAQAQRRGPKVNAALAGAALAPAAAPTLAQPALTPAAAALAPRATAAAPIAKAAAPVVNAAAPVVKALPPVANGLRAVQEQQYNTAGCNFVVGAPGGPRSIQAVLRRLGPNPIRAPKVICLLPGVYRERVHVAANQHAITFKGFNRQKTLIVAAAWQQSKAQDPVQMATLIVDGHLFQAQGFTVENAHRNITTPSPAVSINGRRSTWQDVSIIAWCDTLYTSTSNHLFTNCLVAGLTDMIWGYGRCAFVNCNIFVRFWYDPNIVYTGHIATFGTEYTSFGITGGAVFYLCKIYGPGLSNLGQAYRPDVIVVYDSCYLGPAVAAKGWGNLFNFFTRGRTRFLEFNSFGPGARFGQRQYGRAIKGPVPPPFTVKGFIGRTTA